MAWYLEDGTFAPLSRASGNPRDRRLRPHLFLVHLGSYLHRRRQRDGAARRTAAAGHGVHPVPPDRDLRCRLPDHRGGARRRRLYDQCRGRALHGALCAARQGSRFTRRGQPGDDDRDPRGPRLRAAKGPHPAASRASRRPNCCTSACPEFRRRRKIFSGVECDARADPGVADRALQHGRHPDQLSRRGAAPDRERSGRDSARADGDRRGGLRFGARRQPARLQLASGHRRLRPRRGAPGGRAGAPGHGAQAAVDGVPARRRSTGSMRCGTRKARARPARSGSTCSA